jgi:D-arginine dehydrogenase
MGDTAKNSEFVIIGAGFAGAATSYFLHRAGVTDYLILEAEDLPGMRASGLNAALGRQMIADPEFRHLAMAGMAFLRHPPAGFTDTSLVDSRGSLLLFSAKDRERAAQLARVSQQDGLQVAQWTADQLHHKYPLMKDADSALLTPSDGIIDIHTLLYAYLHPARHAGKLITNTRVIQIRCQDNRWILSTTAGEFHAGIIVNAAGAWAGAIAQLAGAEDIPLQVRRRHLFVSSPTNRLDPRAPFIWDVSHGYYFRPESGGIMFSACDEELTSPDDAYREAPGVQSLLLTKLQRHCPALADLPIARHWAGARTFAPNDKFLARWDARAPGFFWIAGLGGHGATCSSAMGQLASRILLQGQ